MVTTGAEEFGLASRGDVTRRLVAMMTHSLSEGELFFLCFLLLDDLLKEGEPKSINVGGTRLGHAL